MKFIQSGSLWDGRRFRLLNVIDDYNREVLVLEADLHPKAHTHFGTVKAIQRPAPDDPGRQWTEFISRELDHWCKELLFIQPGKPMQKGFIKRCNGNIRRELLNAYVFKTLDEVRLKAEEYMVDYNYHRPHKALNYRAPADLLEDV